MTTIESVKHNGYTIKIWIDEDSSNPREEFDNIATMVSFAKRYTIGDEQHREVGPWLADLVSELYGKRVDRFDDAIRSEDPVAMRRAWLLVGGKATVLPLYLYDHSIQSISTRTFHGRAQHAAWDSGQVGYIYVTDDKIKHEFSLTEPADILEKAKQVMVAEVETYDQWMTGQVYGYTIVDADGNSHDSCGGFYGSWGESGLLDEAKAAIPAELPEITVSGVKLKAAQVNGVWQWIVTEFLEPAYLGDGQAVELKLTAQERSGLLVTA